MNVCKAIECPFFSELTNNYGCQRYVVASMCHLKEYSSLSDNQYALFGELDNNQIQALKAINNQFCLNDKTYEDKIEFQEENADWFSETEFKVKTVKA